MLAKNSQMPGHKKPVPNSTNRERKRQGQRQREREIEIERKRRNTRDSLKMDKERDKRDSKSFYRII